MRTSTRTAAFVVASVTASLLLTACGSDKSESEPKKKAVAEHASEVNPQPASALKQGGELKIPVREWITQFNPSHVEGSQGDRNTIADPMMPSVWQQDAKGVITPDKDYVESVSSVDKGGKQVITYKLNPKAKWSDGTPFSYRDFEAMWKAQGQGNDKFLISESTGYEDIESVKAGANDQEVVVTMKKFSSQYQLMFWDLVPAKYIDTPEKFNKGWVEKIPVTAGPYKLGKMDKTAQTITMVPDANWWGEKPKLDKIVIRVLQPDAQIDAFLNKELDITTASTADYYKRLKGAKDTDFRIGSPWDETHMTFGSEGVVSDVKVRQAVQMAVDNKVMADIAGKGLPVEFKTLGSHFYMPNQVGYQDNSGKYGKGDVAAAGKLLDEAGWKSGGEGQIRTKDGKKLELNYVTGAGASATVKARDAATQSMLKKVGIDMKINEVSQNDYFNKYVNKGAFDITGFRFTSRKALTSDGFGIYRDPKGGQIFQNYGKVVTPGGEAKFREALAAKTPEEARKLQNEADKLFWDAGHSLEIFQTPAIIATPKKLANYGSPGLASVEWAKVGYMK
ncbi:ABC transporter family substrate-binding protein [Streptomyces sp. NPDC021093]|uniref:ABC transporter family substrate-binding protein n=1 Tax=Streptomyces sp. NPDC021093 TaxID=3365112 RepID=UPI0037B79F88